MSKNALGQHWLNDPGSLYAVVQAAGITKDDTVLEIGPGGGTLTEVLLAEAKAVVAVEIDTQLADTLAETLPTKNLTVIQQDVLQFDLSSLPAGYKVAANIPYYITSPIIMYLLESRDRPSQLGVLVQKEVAQRIAAKPGDLSVLGVAVQSLAVVELFEVVPAHYFKPQPKVDSQIIRLIPHDTPKLEPFDAVMKLVKAGFLNRRKTLANSLASTLPLSKHEVLDCIKAIGLSENVRAQELRLADWQALHDTIKI